jgi:hypothetical protein
MPSANARTDGIWIVMELCFYNVTFDGCGSTSVIARTSHDAASHGRRFAQIGRTNVRITTPDARTYTLEQVDAALAARDRARK